MCGSIPPRRHIPDACPLAAVGIVHVPLVPERALAEALSMPPLWHVIDVVWDRRGLPFWIGDRVSRVLHLELAIVARPEPLRHVVEEEKGMLRESVELRGPVGPREREDRQRLARAKVEVGAGQPALPVIHAAVAVPMLSAARVEGDGGVVSA